MNITTWSVGGGVAVRSREEERDCWAVHHCSTFITHACCWACFCPTWLHTVALIGVGLDVGQTFPHQFKHCTLHALIRGMKLLVISSPFCKSGRNYPHDWRRDKTRRMSGKFRRTDIITNVSSPLPNPLTLVSGGFKKLRLASVWARGNIQGFTSPTEVTWMNESLF